MKAAFVVAVAIAFVQIAMATYEWGGGTGDPILTGLDGRSFEFFGKAANVYSLLSEKTHQVSMKLKEGKMWDHEGTYMTALGFQYHNHTLEVSETEGELSVTLDGEQLAMRHAQTEQEIILGLAEGQMNILWQLHRAEHGNTVEVTTDMLQVVMWVTPAGTRDEGGVIQPAYLNFDLALTATPAHSALEGILGQTYSKAGAASTEENDFKFHGNDADFEMESLFALNHAKCIFGRASGGKARKLIESSVALPLRASSRGPSRA